MKIETIADIVAEKRNRADEIERDVAEKMKRGEMISDQFAREVVAYLRKEADRIEAAAKREREVGAEAAQICGEIGEMIGRESALSDPPRNCDLYTVGEALRKYGFPTKIKPWGEKEWLDFCEWLVSEVEGETKVE